MRIPEASIAEVLQEVSEKLADESFVSESVNELIRRQPSISQYVIAHNNELSADSILQVMFQVAMVEKIIIAATGRRPTLVGFPDLNRAATTCATLDALADTQEDLASYLFTNLEMAKNEKEVAGRVLAHVSRAMLPPFSPAR